MRARIQHTAHSTIAACFPPCLQLEDPSPQGVNEYLSELVEGVMGELEQAGCVESDEGDTLRPTTLGRVASYYYLKYSRSAKMLASDRILRSACLPPPNSLHLPTSTFLPSASPSSTPSFTTSRKPQRTFPPYCVCSATPQSSTNCR